jgi:hypothetical protein
VNNQDSITRDPRICGDDFVCAPQGAINIKGKGEMDVWHVSAMRSGPADQWRQQAQAGAPQGALS